jgi:hypothetical protein
MNEQNFIFITTEVDYKRLEEQAFQRNMTVAEFVATAIRRFSEEPVQTQNHKETAQFEAVGRKRLRRRVNR